ncbi:hypothetical protein FHT86_002202 [Rhizobium sp. BK313]|uniref:dATP/dGTP pyrophosphohydrolase domain-containing protein n=1 Tax=Rhizobium sp. BK313 TaxID=2587081 RepID=UPI0017F93C57|nr:dATP/dGTP pyrophosphohydrolase domain-containing protein [Rhizobium sp. BK313]MBB3453946.1 hypothetical protein [Rhizobium sp. BK313]
MQITNEMIDAFKEAFHREYHARPDNSYDDNIKAGLIAALTAAPASPAREPEPKVEDNLLSYYERQIAWSRQTFGPALRTKGVIDHIRKELCEIEQDPHDLSEWVDVVILAMDGFWRHGGNAADLFAALLAKQQKNMARTWPDWRTMSEDQAIEHDRSNDATLASMEKKG